MPNTESTLENANDRGGAADLGPAIPGLVLVFCAGAPRCEVLPLVDGAITLGRSEALSGRVDDPRMSRQHAEVRFDGARWTVRDLASRNGTSVDGRPVADLVVAAQPRVIGLADSLLVALPDVRAFRTVRIAEGDAAFVGAALGQCLRTIAQAARTGDVLHVRGESGAGKELAARTFHERGRGGIGAFVAINCAAVPEGVAERLLFGARRGAYSGAVADTEGLVQAAHGGTLFLDEVAELDLGVQAKLLRVIETREVLPLGASKPQAVLIRVCSATHRDLRAEVRAGRFREDLYYRLGTPAVSVPPLRARLEEVPWLVARAVRSADAALQTHASLVEACALRSWPGNVRELLAEVRSAAQHCLGEGRSVVEARHLAAHAGVSLVESDPPAGPGTMDAATVSRALEASDGNVSAAARALGLHRNQLRRLIERLGMSAKGDGGDQ